MGDSGQIGDTEPRDGLTRLLLVGAVVTVVVGLIVGPGFARRSWTDAPDESPDWDERWFPYASPPADVPSPPAAASPRRAPEGRVLIAAGVSRIGDDATPSALPPATVALPAFRIDRTEVSVGAYATFVAATGHPPAQPTGDDGPGEPDLRLPVSGVTHDDASAYCRYVAARLPTSLEWERAARGTSGRRYPWGDAWHPQITNTVWRVAGAIPSLAAWQALLEQARNGTAGQNVGPDPVGTNPGDVTPEGVFDLHGNVREWTASGLGDPTGLPAVLNHPLIAVARGVGFVSRDYAASSAARFPYRKDWTADDLGFRCAVSEP